MPLGRKCRVCDKITLEHTRSGEYVGTYYHPSLCSDRCIHLWDLAKQRKRILEKLKRKKRRTHSYTIKKLKPEILEKFKSMCYLCHSTNDLVVHHIIPFAQGGTAELKNLCLVCRDCHHILHNNSSSKLSKWPDGYCCLNPKFFQKRLSLLNKLKELRDDITLITCKTCKWPHTYLKIKEFGSPEKEQVNIDRSTKKSPRKIGRNDLCSCNSGKKYKKCCLRYPLVATQVTKYLA